MNADRHKLRWTRSSAEKIAIASLPDGITRTFISTPGGPLELLSAHPISSATSDAGNRKKALLFQHGGFGCASVWIPYITYFSKLGYPCYAVSLRGHGASWKPGYWTMTWCSGVGTMAQDLLTAVTFVRGIETGQRLQTENPFQEEDLVLLGHSAGGGIIQYFLSKSLGNVGGAVIIAGFPCFGGYGVYWNWLKNDPWFLPRYYIRDLWHPRSPLSSTSLVHRAFFSPSFPRASVKIFESFMSEYETMIGPFQMMVPFVKVKNVVKNILGWQARGQRMLIVAGELDLLMSVMLMRQMAEAYRETASEMLVDRKKEEDGQDGSVRFAIVRESGHHLQNDLHWEEGAAAVSDFLQQL